ncbi:E3 ubiquitin/ISG15 ligase TRIM25-like isoform X2 [Rhinatrema bivittatum]|uniref:E3 ubiquitin/ISG15 ligase TRIM25-like isoform X2 n=1 Tax=Rhinatrema bivittatum TaxID=194408 RepID=UPI00112748FC|nr:E3 ubiquitin/ISG15 ligase TRIM25-like isoform X2 [Rhinatrema bivittatum]
MAEARMSLGELAEELTCPICLATFDTPVTIQCGHNFCRLCLELTWAAASSYSCPQCRLNFPTKPELRKNTVLATVVEQFLQSQEQQQQQQEEEEDDDDEEPESQEEEEKGRQGLSGDAVVCDHCLRATAVRTCFTCMVSFCQEHLEPHLESLAFRDHQLRPPLANLQQRKCPEHGKLLEYFCWEHGQCICCICVVLHKTCKTSPLQEAKTKKQNLLANLLKSVHAKAEKVSSALEEVQTKQTNVDNVAERKKALLREEFSEIKDLIEKEEQEAMQRVEEEGKRVSQKFDYTHKVLCRKKNECEKLQGQLEFLLCEEDEITFLKNAVQLKDTSSKDAFVPYIDFDQKLLQALYRRAFSLKETMKYAIQPPSAGEAGSPLPGEKPVQMFLPPSIPPRINIPPPAGKQRPYPGRGGKQDSNLGDKPGLPPKPFKTANPGTKNSTTSASVTSGQSKSRQELLHYAENLCLDFKTAHKRVVLSNNNTRISVTDIPQNYSDSPQRFTHCSQVLCLQGFSQGLHYWEVDIQSSTFCGIGIAYKSIDRKGADSRLGRNRVSWCIEWFNAKLSAWHNDSEEILTNLNPSKVGVLLDCDEGYVIFYSVAKKKNTLLYKFQARFTESVYPAFWVFSSNTTVSLCQLK